MELELAPGVELLGSDAVATSEGTAVVDLGVLQYGARRSVVLQARNCTSSPVANATLRYNTPAGDRSAGMQPGEGEDEQLYAQARRVKFVDSVHKLMDQVVA